MFQRVKYAYVLDVYTVVVIHAFARVRNKKLQICERRIYLIVISWCLVLKYKQGIGFKKFVCIRSGLKRLYLAKDYSWRRHQMETIYA